MKHTPGPLPEGWTITPNGFIHYKKDGYCKYVKDRAGRIDRHSIALTLENYGYPDHARRWFLSPVEAAAPELLEACQLALITIESAPRTNIFTRTKLTIAIAKAKGE